MYAAVAWVSSCVLVLPEREREREREAHRELQMCFVSWFSTTQQSTVTYWSLTLGENKELQQIRDHVQHFKPRGVLSTLI